jgi:hypothetical protein
VVKKGYLRLTAGDGGHIATHSAGLELDPDLRIAASWDVDAEASR